MLELDALLTRHKAQTERADWHAALVASTIANVHRGQDQEPYKISDFMPSGDAAVVEPQTVETQIALVELWNAALGGADLRNRAMAVSD